MTVYESAEMLTLSEQNTGKGKPLSRRATKRTGVLPPKAIKPLSHFTRKTFPSMAEIMIENWRRFGTLLLVAMLAGCDPVVKSEPNGTRFERVEEVQCRHHGYCYTCMPGLGGKGCGFKHSAFCPGTQQVKVAITPIMVTHRSGLMHADSERVIVERMSQCE